MSLYSDLPPASDEPVKPEVEAQPAPIAASTTTDEKATAGWTANPALLIPQINIVRQRPRPASEAPRKKPLMMKVVKPAAPIVNMIPHSLPSAPPAVESRDDRNDEINDFQEYDPAVPNEYLQLCRERRAERDRLQREKELQEFLKIQEEKQEKQPVQPLELNVSGEDAYMRRMRMSGMAPVEAPPESESPALTSSAPRSPSPEPYVPPVSVSATQPVAKQSVAERLMAKMGWQSGQGLGAQGQGIKQALVAKKDGSGHLQIAEPTKAKKKQKGGADCVVLLENMVGKGEVDGELERETAEECRKFGEVLQCRIYERASDVRIFVKFANESSGRLALDALNGRLFGGRRIRATNYDSESFSKEDFDL